jgi:hypothetical protein
MNPHAQLAPINFRHPEDLRVRHAGYERAAGAVFDTLDVRQELSNCLSGELQHLAAELSKRAFEGIEPYSAARTRLEAALQARAEVRHSVPAEAEAGDLAAAPCAASPASGAEAERDSLVALLELHAARHASCACEAEQAWARVEVACESRIDERHLAAEELDCAARGERVTLAAQELYKAAACAVEERQEEESFQTLCRNYCKDVERAAPFIETSRSACAELWRQALRLAADLEGELAIQGGLQALLQEKDRTRKLLAAELGAPAEARRALATVRLRLWRASRCKAQTTA